MENVFKIGDKVKSTKKFSAPGEIYNGVGVVAYVYPNINVVRIDFGGFYKLFKNDNENLELVD